MQILSYRYLFFFHKFCSLKKKKYTLKLLRVLRCTTLNEFYLYSYLIITQCYLNNILKS